MKVRSWSATTTRVPPLPRRGRALGDGEPADLHRQGFGLEAGARAAGAGELAPVPREEDAHVELVAVGLHLLEEAADPGKVAVSLLEPLLVRVREIRIGTRDVQAPALGRLEELLLVPAPRRVAPRLDGAVGEAPRRVGDQARLVVAEDVAEALAVRAGA